MIRSFVKTLGLVIAAFVALFFVAVAKPERAAPLPEHGQDRLIINARIVDVANGTTSEVTNVRIRGGTIVEIGKSLSATPEESVLDGAGGYLIPGLWDMHVHTFQSSPQMHFPLWIANGVTHVRDMMGCPQESDTLVACARDKRRWNGQIAKGNLAAPRIVETVSFYLEGDDLTPAEAGRLVRRYSDRGLDAIKVYNRLTRPAYHAAARAARSRNLRVVGHLPKAVSLEDAIAAGQSSFEHAHLLPRHCFDRAQEWRSGKLDDLPPTDLIETIVSEYDPATCETAFAALRDAGSWYVPTHVTREEDARAGDPAFVNDPRLDFLDPLLRWAWNDDLSATRSRYAGVHGERALRAYFSHGLRLTGEAHDAGVNVLVGTDTAIGGFRYHDELAHLVKAGMTEGEVLKAATLDAARYAGMDDVAGSITVGKRADLVLLSANPLHDIANTRKIRAVVQSGRLYDRKQLDQLLAFARNQARSPNIWAKLLWGFARSSVTGDL